MDVQACVAGRENERRGRETRSKIPSTGRGVGYVGVGARDGGAMRHMCLPKCLLDAASRCDLTSS